MLIAKRRNKHYMASTLAKVKGENCKMLELAKAFLGKECIISTFNDVNITGVIKEISENAMLIENSKSLEVVNLNFVVRIRQYPQSKSRNKKSRATV